MLRAQKLVHLQLQSFARLQLHFSEKLESLEKFMARFLEGQKQILTSKQMLILEFNLNFNKVSTLHIPPQYGNQFREEVSSLFDQEKLENWVKISQQRLLVLKDKLSSVDELLRGKAGVVREQLQKVQLLKESIQLHDMSFTMLKS